MIMKYPSFIFAICLSGLCFGSKQALAATATTSFGVSATVQASCRVSSAAREFGTYRAVTEPLMSGDAVHCSYPTAYNVLLSAGRAITSTKASQAGRLGSTSVGFDFLSNALLSLNRPPPLGAYTSGDTGLRLVKGLPVNGGAMRMPYVAPDSYADTVIVTVIY